MCNNYRERILRRPSGSFFLFGPRGVGKSVWVRKQLPTATRFDLLDEGLANDLQADPSRFAAELRGVRRGAWVIVDEVQRIPALLNEVHRFIEERGLRFALLGSSARKLKAAGTNLLAGRAVRLAMFPFVPAELGDAFDLNRVLRFGSIPLIWKADDPRATLEAYVQTYLREEVRAEALVRNLPGFLRFLPIAALFHGQIVNVSSIARDAGTARSTVDGYLDILDDTLLTFRLPGYEARLRVRERKHPKLYWVDPGLVRAIKRQFDPVIPEERGPLLEGWVLEVLRAHGEAGRLYDEIFYWSPPGPSGVEVDFLLRRGRKFLAIEVKAQPRYHRSMLGGLVAIGELRGIARRILIYGGSRKLTTEEGIEVWPVDELGASLSAGTLWP